MQQDIWLSTQFLATKMHDGRQNIDWHTNEKNMMSN
jgi:hypothetical protein